MLSVTFALRRLCLAAVLCATGACASEHANPSAPTPRSVTPSMAGSLTGRVTATNGGQALAGIAVTADGHTAVTDAAGAFTLQGVSTGAQRLLLTGSGVVPRSLTVAIDAAREISVDAIQTAGFDLNFYRQIVRNALEAPGRLQPLRRWTQDPRLYIRTIDETGMAIDPRTLELTERTIRETTPIWTAGQFEIAAVERGTETRVNVAGWITVNWVSAAHAGVCGYAAVGGNAIELRTNQACRCPGAQTSATLVRHELGHTLGYWHTDGAMDVMTGLPYVTCDQQPSARERGAAAIAYARPVGNADEDADPVDWVRLVPYSGLTAQASLTPSRPIP
jgi:hypothetical protein